MRTQGTLFARMRAVWTTTFKGDLADAADVLVFVLVADLIFHSLAFFQLPSPAAVEQRQTTGSGAGTARDRRVSCAPYTATAW